MDAPPDWEAAQAFAQSLARRDLVYELAGLFWVGAEMGILYAVLAARHMLQHWERGGEAQWPRRLAAAFALLFILLTAATLSRHAMGSGASDAAALAAEVVAAGRAHMAIWAGFVTLWVILEAAIVLYGIGVYSALRRRLEHSARTSRISGAGSTAVLLGAFFLLLPGIAGASALQTVEAAYAADGDLRQALLLYLRIASCFWIFFEWIAAVYMARVYFLLKAHPLGEKEPHRA